ncbi:putative transposase [Sinorhizobium phage phiM6]|nr:putative transposase [Sinorhizobium phage phiM6]
MKYFKLAMIGLFGLFLASCDRVPAGNVGVKVDLYGSEKGVSVQELPPGKYWVGINEELFIFPTFSQTYTWQEDNGEAISFQDKEGMPASADIGITYSIDPTKVTDIFQKYRKGVDEITNTYLRNMVRDALVKRSSNKPLDYLYGPGKSELIENVQGDVTAQVKSLGINIEKIYWVGAIQLPPEIKDRINKKNEVGQITLQRQAEVQETIAAANKKIEEARGEAESARLKAQGQADANLAVAKADAESIRLKAEAEADGIKARAQSITKELVEYETVKTWKGGVPSVVTGGSGTVQILDLLKAGATSAQ